MSSSDDEEKPVRFVAAPGSNSEDAERPVRPGGGLKLEGSVAVSKRKAFGSALVTRAPASTRPARTIPAKQPAKQPVKQGPIAPKESESESEAAPELEISNLPTNNLNPASVTPALIQKLGMSGTAALSAAAFPGLGQEPVTEVDPVIAKPFNAVTGYRPTTSIDFSHFIYETYSQYSPYLERLATEGADAANIPKAIDKEACKKRKANKVSTFYYQSFVRDYLSRGTPYRGLLVYHGLGTGKTCTSIAAVEALYWGGQKKIYIMTPATLSNNYRKDLGKCGYYPLRTDNFWAFLKLADAKNTAHPIFIWLTDVLGLPSAIVLKQGGGWVPNPDKDSNWDKLTEPVQQSIRVQQDAHLKHRFEFIHYNGILPTTMAKYAVDGLAAGKSIFDDAVVVIDEIHNLVRTINGTTIRGASIPTVIETMEPHEPTWTLPLNRETPGFAYPRGYTLYRLLQNAVGAKIIALSATPMINYAQEYAILMNIIGGERRAVQIPLATLKGATAALSEWAKRRPDIDFYKVEEAADRSPVLTVTPVPYGFVKVLSGEGTSYQKRGFVRLPPTDIPPVKESRERNMTAWATSLVADMVATGMLAPVAFKLQTYPLLPDDDKEFVTSFVDRVSLKLINSNTLKARSTGLISYYRGGSEELMPRTGLNEIVLVPMSDYMFEQYAVVRRAEQDKESQSILPEQEAKAKGKAKGRTAAEADLYAQATKTPQTGFLVFSRAACNWVFPDGVERPNISDAKKRAKLLGLKPPKQEGDPSAVQEDDGQDVELDTTDVLPTDEPPAPPPPVDAALEAEAASFVSSLEGPDKNYLTTALDMYSPKYKAMIDNISLCTGPVLVYSQFKTLEGLGIFAAALRATEKFIPLDIVQVGGVWGIPEELMTGDNLVKQRYILYTGDQKAEKRRLLLQLYNAELDVLPSKLASQCKELLGPEESDNRTGAVCKIFMITQSGAEGISLYNTRQVHIMEPYWNNVRLQQVIGRAIRLCSHANLPWEDRVVDVFTYLSVFSDVQKQGGSAARMMTMDKFMTTDQMIFDIATKKQKLADGLFSIAQSSAVDCLIHRQEHGRAIQCYSFPPGAEDPPFMFNPDWRKDLQTMVRTAAASDV